MQNYLNSQTELNSNFILHGIQLNKRNLCDGILNPLEFDQKDAAN